MGGRSPGEDEETERRSADALQILGFDVTVIEGPDVGKNVQVHSAGGRVQIGTSEVCDLRLSDPAVSRRHVALEVEGYRMRVTDLGSTNGTFANDTSIVAAYLHGRDLLRLGGTVLKVLLKPVTPKSVEHADGFGRLVGRSAAISQLFALAERLARSDVSVLIEGETGTGKELLAECLHEASARAASPFVVLDCRTTPRASLEAVLFGEEPRDGREPRQGVFEMAKGGTVFIDEPGDLDLDVQGKLLRVLDKREILPVGADQWRKIDVRVLCATSRNLDKLVEEQKFREDFFFRIAGARIELPALRARRDDVKLLAEHFWRTHGGEGALPQSFLEHVSDYTWPGNVRELEQSIARFIALGEAAGLRIDRSSRPRKEGQRDSIAPPGGGVEGGGEQIIQRVLDQQLTFQDGRQRVLQEFERAFIARALAEHGGNVGRAAASYGIGRRYFQMIRARQPK